jgi:hypothetical protein
MPDKVRPECGTVKGSFIHSSFLEPQCEVCRADKRERDAARRSSAEYRATVRARSRADRRTFARMKRMFPAAYLKIQAEERARAFREEFGGD